jgi:tetratricopeptide (TPR) repeat protein
MRKISFLLTLVALAGCATPSPGPTTSPLRLPTRIPTTTPAPTPTPVDVQPYYEAGLAYQETGNLAEALQSFTWAIQLAPGFAPAYVARGSVYLAQGELYPALADAEAALEIDPTNALAHALRGEALRLMGRHYLAAQAFDQALELDSALKPETFRSRWLAARGTRDRNRLLKLSYEYTVAHPDDPTNHYYRGWAFIEQGDPHSAIEILIRGIETAQDPPGLLWFALGYAYSANHSWQEALTSFETTRTLVQMGDTSLDLHSDQPVADLFTALGQAYLKVGRCVDAEAMLDYAIAVGAPASEYAAMLEEAYLCQTPTPTFTPYPTVTPPW